MKISLKKFITVAGVAMMFAGGAGADLVYSTDFTTSYATDNGAFVLGGGTPDVTAGDWFGSSQTTGIASDVLTIDIPNDNRYRGAGVWLDTTGWATGLVTVEVDVTSYTAGTDGARTLFQAYSATGVTGTNTVSMDLHAAPGGAILATNGTATISALGTEQLITGTGTDLPFTFSYTGAEQFVALVFANENPNVTPNTNIGATVTLDNLSVNTVPEPSSLILLGMGAVVLLRRHWRG